MYASYPSLDQYAVWDIHTDGKRFLKIKPFLDMDYQSAAEHPRQIYIPANWFEELKERVPAE
jgi:hypothetical protein